MLKELVASFEYTVGFVEELVADLGDQEMSLQPSGAPNHATWTLGHIVHSCHAMAVEFGAEAWLPEEWEARFGYGTKPAAGTPSDLTKDALLRNLGEARDRLSQRLRQLGADALAVPLPAEEGDNPFPTMGHILVQVVGAHTAYHAGQLAAWRRAIGRPPVGVFI